MSYGGFDVVKTKKNNDLSDYSDYQLVKLTQKDVDEYRSLCNWVCPKCSYKFRYEISLLMVGKIYVHEMKCPDEVRKGKSFVECKEKMALQRDDEKSFDSLYFNELFARYQDRIIWESMKSFVVDSPDEVYSILISAFLKIVLQFARDKSFSSKSDKWFSSFFWRSVQNKIADLQKTNTYNKRCPTVKCAMCGKLVGQITSRHLSLPGHENLLTEILIRQGRFVIEDSGEIDYYNTHKDMEEKIKDRSLFIGMRRFSKRTKNERKKIFESECLEIYSKMFPNALFKNNVASTNSTIKEDGDTEFSEISNDSVFGGERGPADEIEIDSSISLLADTVIDKIGDELDGLLKVDLDKNQLKEIIYKSLSLKCSFVNDSENSKVDSMIDEVKRGFTGKLLEIVRSSNDCRICVGVESNSSNDLVPA